MTAKRKTSAKLKPPAKRKVRAKVAAPPPPVTVDDEILASAAPEGEGATLWLVGTIAVAIVLLVALAIVW
jgi:hypothetical protein